MDKEKLLQSIRDWIKYDEELKVLQSAQKEIKEKKKLLTNNLIEIMKTNEIDCFDINNGKLLYHKSKTRSSLNKKLLIESLGKYFDGRDDIDVGILSTFILDSRDIKESENIKRK